MSKAVKKEPRIAVIVLNWRRPDFTIDCVKSFQNSSYKNFRIFVVDNGSDDDSVERFKSELTDVEIIGLDENYGYAGGNNRAFEKIDKYGKFDLVLVSNNDLTVEKDAVKELVAVAKRLGADNIFVPAMYMNETKDAIICAGIRSAIPSPFQFRYHSGDAELEVREVPYLPGAFFLIKRELLRKLSGFQEDFYMYGEDIDLGLRAQKLGARVYFVPQSKVHHEFHGSSGRFSPLSRYYLARNVPRIIRDHSSYKSFDYFKFFFWGFLSIPFLVAMLKFKSAGAWLWGVVDFLKGKYGKNRRLGK